MTKEEEAKRLILEEVKKAVLTLEEHFQKFADENKTAVPMTYIKVSNKLFLDSYEKACVG